MIKRLILLKFQNMIDINADLLQWFGNFSNKKISVGTVKNDNISNKELAKRIKQTNY